MKKLTVLLGFCSLLTFMGRETANAQIRQLPDAVKSAFAKKYPDVQKVTWEDKIIYVLARFTGQNDKECTAKFSSKGEWQWTETAMKFEDLPGPVQDGFNKSKYVDWQVDHVFLVDQPAAAGQYKIQAQKSPVQKRNLVFSAKGRLLSDNITMY